MSRPRVGYAAMLERFGPGEVTEYAVAAERAGFSGVMAADHFQPWVPHQGQAPFVWNVLTAIGERTVGDLGPGVTCPSFRFHPSVIAQASATLAVMYPDRHWLGLGSGEALNEHAAAGYWPEAPERIARMWEAIEIIQGLFTGKDHRHAGKFFKMETCRLWTLPATPPPIYVGTAGPITAKRAGRTVDGIITPGASLEKVSSVLAKFDEGASEGGRDPGQQTKTLQLHLSWASTDEAALEQALREWPTGGMNFPKQDIRSPYDFEKMAKLVRAEDFKDRLLISSDLDAHRAHIQSYFDLGVDRIYLHNVGRNQKEWIDVFSRDVLPSLVA